MARRCKRGGGGWCYRTRRRRAATTQTVTAGLRSDRPTSPRVATQARETRGASLHARWPHPHDGAPQCVSHWTVGHAPIATTFGGVVAGSPMRSSAAGLGATGPGRPAVCRTLRRCPPPRRQPHRARARPGGTRAPHATARDRQPSRPACDRGTRSVGRRGSRAGQRPTSSWGHSGDRRRRASRRGRPRRAGLPLWRLLDAPERHDGRCVSAPARRRRPRQVAGRRCRAAVPGTHDPSVRLLRRGKGGVAVCQRGTRRDRWRGRPRG